MSELRIGAFSGIGRVRESNQDHYLVQNTIANDQPLRLCLPASGPLLCAVADGMGGHRGGDRASRIALEVLARDYFARARTDHEGAATAQRLRACVAAADAEVRTVGEREPSLYGMGTTMVGLVLDGEQACGFNAGDSRLYRLRQRSLQQLSSDHSLVAELERAGKLTREQAEVDDRKQVLTNCIGGFPDMVMYVDTLPQIAVHAGDRFLLCSDGVTNAIDTTELEAICRSDDEPLAVARRLVEESDRRGGFDNATAVVIEVVA